MTPKKPGLDKILLVVFSKKNTSPLSSGCWVSSTKKGVESFFFFDFFWETNQVVWKKLKSVQIHGETLEFFDKAGLLHPPTRKTSKKAFQPPLENSKILAPVLRVFFQLKKTMKKTHFMPLFHGLWNNPNNWVGTCHPVYITSVMCFLK